MDKEYKITNIFDEDISDMHHISVTHDGVSYSLIFGKYANGGFCSVPNHRTGCELAAFDDVFWNSEALGRAFIESALAHAIAEYSKTIEKEHTGACVDTCDKMQKSNIDRKSFILNKADSGSKGMEI